MEVEQMEFEELLARTDRVGDCWLWLGPTMKNGYGVVHVDGLTQLAHRAAYELAVGPIPEGRHLDHLCRVRPCIRPTHLEPVTQAENNRRAGAAKTHCRHGHLYTADNTYRSPKGERRCRECQRISNRDSRAQKAVLA